MSRTSPWLRSVCIAGLAAAVLFPVSTITLAAEKSLIEPKWDDPDLKKFLEERAATRSLGAKTESDRDQVKLPVLEMSAPPEAATRSMKASPEAETPPVFLFDEKNPVWYQVTHTYGDVTVTIEADRRVLQELGPEDQVTESSTTRGLAPTGEDVSVYSDAEEEGAPGYVAEYTIEKFGVPYTVRVECTAAVKEECADKAKVAETQALLKITGGSPDGTP